MATPFQNHVRRVGSEAEDELNHRKTGVQCQYVDHPDGMDFPDNDYHAVMIVAVDNSSCCPRNQDNEQLNMCWPCVVSYPFRDRFQCACKEENSVHKSNELTFVSEIKSADVPA